MSKLRELPCNLLCVDPKQLRPFEMRVGALVGEGCSVFFPIKVKMLQRSVTQVCRQGEVEESKQLEVFIVNLRFNVPAASNWSP